jgi:D-glycero-alpha-D-manno-heptose-7-phosphate kinase
MLAGRAPTRLDFGGGWTDVPPYPEERGGFVCNVAITRYASVTIGGPPAHDTPPLAAAALRRSGHAALPASISSDFPVGSGLGGSSAAGVAMAAVLAALRGESLSHGEIAEWSRAVEVEELGIAGGRQDHYAAAFGGALGLTFGSTVEVEQIPLLPDFVARLERRCLLAYTGESRISAGTISAVLDAYTTRDARVVAALARMKTLAWAMRAALHAGDADTLAALVDEHWMHQRSLHPGISTARIDALDAAVRAAGATGMKALGASGGGCVIVFADDDAVPAVQRAIEPLATLMEWHVAREGVSVSRVQPRPHDMRSNAHSTPHST